jgi:leucine dehydrogenase
MGVFSHPAFDNHEQVNFYHDARIGLRAIIALHRTGERHALGGTRIVPYASEDEALQDVLRLSRAMTYKCAMANLPYGGGKAVIIGDPLKEKSVPLLHSFGRCVDGLGGRFVTGEDVGVGVEDVEVMREVTKYVVGQSGSDSSAPAAYGVFSGIRAAVQHKLGRADLEGLRIAIQGLGQVGYALCRYLHQAGAHLTVADSRDERVQQVVKEFGVQAVHPDDIYDQSVEIFAPCALGGVISRSVASILKATIIAGAANNQLAEPELDEVLAERGILYAPDYVINAGGVINNAMHLEQYDRDRVMVLSGEIYLTLLEVFRQAEQDHLPPGKAADRIAEERMTRHLVDHA